MSFFCVTSSGVGAQQQELASSSSSASPSAAAWLLLPSCVARRQARTAAPCCCLVRRPWLPYLLLLRLDARPPAAVAAGAARRRRPAAVAFAVVRFPLRQLSLAAFAPFFLTKPQTPAPLHSASTERRTLYDRALLQNGRRGRSRRRWPNSGVQHERTGGIAAASSSLPPSIYRSRAFVVKVPNPPTHPYNDSLSAIDLRRLSLTQKRAKPSPRGLPLRSL